MILEQAKRGLQSSEPQSKRLLWWCLWILIVFCAPSKHIEATIIIMIIGAFVSAVMLIAPFITYSKFYRDLSKDMDFVRSDVLDTLG